ncbi:hypothetical protein TNCV_4187191 [Trichonephila clavipes]|nr:hypothetical protein TNCV_4187191 [Trichonephila clavipes]
MAIHSKQFVQVHPLITTINHVQNKLDGEQLRKQRLKKAHGYLVGYFSRAPSDFNPLFQELFDGRDNQVMITNLCRALSSHRFDSLCIGLMYVSSDKAQTPPAGMEV